MHIERKYILGVKVDFGYSFYTAVSSIKFYLEQNKKCHVCTTNPEFIMDAQNDPIFKDIINNSDFSFPDGIGVLYAEKYLDSIKNIEKRNLYQLEMFFQGLKIFFNALCIKNYLKPRIDGVTLTYQLLEMCEKEGRSVFLLGGKSIKDPSKNISELTALELLKKYPQLKIIGFASHFSSNEVDDNATVNHINTCSKEKLIDIVFVAYGHGKQEKWIERNKEKINATCFVGIGGTFNYISKDELATPLFMKNLNLEWLYRLLTQQWRLKRILKAFPLFPLKLYLDTIKR